MFYNAYVSYSGCIKGRSVCDISVAILLLLIMVNLDVDGYQACITNDFRFSWAIVYH